MTYEEIELYENASKFLLVGNVPSKDPNTPKKLSPDLASVLVLNRTDDNARPQMGSLDSNDERVDAIFKSMKTMTKVYGLMGSIQLLSGKFLVVVLQRELIGAICGEKIWRITKVQFIPYQPKNFRTQDPQQKEREIEYIEMMNKILVEDQSFYFSYNWDLTNRFQSQSNTESNEIFFWNKHLSTEFLTFKPFVLPMIRGLVEIGACRIGNKTFSFGLVSRTGCKRAGTRYNMRGSDEGGNVANYVETEHFIVYDGILTSFTQVRGSIPLIWTQFANLKYTPEISFLTDKVKQRKAFESHFNHLLTNYSGDGGVVVMNLCKEKGQEQKLSDVYRSFWDKAPAPIHDKVQYVTFDFHHECKNMNFSKISVLLNNVSDSLKKIKFFARRFAPSENPNTWNTLTRSHSTPNFADVRFSTSPLASSNSTGNFDFQQPEPQQKVGDLLDFADDTYVTPSTHHNNEDFHNFEPDWENPFASEESASATTTTTPQTIETIPDLQVQPVVEQPLPQELQQQPPSDILEIQLGVTRINCIDCCDRTNVVMTYVSRTVLLEQLYLLGIFKQREEDLSKFPKFESLFNNFWANNGDRVSLLYAGTEALMRDYTRTGQRSVQGILTDGFNSAKRYLQNNFMDVHRQRGLNLVLGLLNLESDEELNSNQRSDLFSELFLL